MPTVNRLPLIGQCNCYLVGDPGAYLLVDAGFRGAERRFARHLRTMGIEPSEIKLAVVTHVHFDHVGSLAALRELCGCPVMVHASEADLLARGAVVIPPGTTLPGRLVSWVGNHAGRFLHFAPVHPDLTVTGPTSLAQWGVNARVIPTPGHSRGSVSVLLPDGEACVGDLMANCLLYEGHGLFPPFAEDVEALYTRWEKLLTAGVHTFYPGHGRPIQARTIRNHLAGDEAVRRREGAVPGEEPAAP
jgi:hydroxyacylglutathione hydrolase